MIANLEPYSVMRDSGVAWLGDVPKGWTILRGRQLFEIRKRIAGELGHPVISVTQAGLRVKDIASGEGQLSQDYSKYQTVEVGEFAMNSMDLLTGGVGIATSPGVTSPDYRVFSIRDKAGCCDRYMLQVLRMLYWNRGFYAWGQGSAQLGRWRLPRRRFNDFPFPVPPFSEQSAIARFLDWANGRLERAIRTKRKVIALLNEQKSTIIHCAVTRGLPSTGSGQAYPSVPLKPSGIPWLGDIPQHWDTPLFGRLLNRVEQGWSPVAAEGELALDQWAVLTLSAVRRGAFNPAAIKPVSLTAKIPKEIEVADGDVLLTRSNTRDRVGDVCIARAPRTKTILCDLIYRLQVRTDAIHQEFLVYQLLSRVGRGQIERDARGSSGTMPKIAQGHIKSWRILLPPMGEQQRIVESIDSDIAPVDIAISRLEREIELLREYRTRLVADVVTGKLDVREAAAKLPEQAGDLEPLDDVDAVTEDDEESGKADLNTVPEETEA